MATVIPLAGCDVTVNLTETGAITSMSNGDVFRGLAFELEQIGEDPATTNRRRDVYELMASKMGVDISKNFVKTLQSNPHFSSVEVHSQAFSPGQETINIATVRFVVDSGPTVALTFWVPDKRMLGFVHLNRLPYLKSAEVQDHGQRLPLRKGATDLMLAAVGNDQDLLATFLKNLRVKFSRDGGRG